ncbi:hypothetical protein FSST1_006310 [Fusarium sambucinum]
MSAPDEKQQLYDLIDVFFSRDPADEVVSSLEKLLTARPAFEEPESDLDSTKDFRYECATRIQQEIRNLHQQFRLQAIHVSTILLVPKESLEDGGFLAYNQPASTLHKNLTSVASLLRHFHLKSREDRYLIPHEATTVEENACLRRDEHGCAFMATADPRVARIVPFSWNNNKANVHETKQVLGALKAFFSDTICDKLGGLLANPDDLGSSEKHWNMIAFNIQLLNYWSIACCGLKCLGIRPKAAQDPDSPDSVEDSPKVSDETEWEVVIQFQWLNRRWVKPNVEMDIMAGNESMQKMAETQINYEKAWRPPPTPRHGDGAIGAVRVDIHAPLISGQTFTFTMSEQDAINCKMALDLRWYLVSIEAMSGAASYPRLLPPADGSDEIGQQDTDDTDSDY